MSAKPAASEGVMAGVPLTTEDKYDVLDKIGHGSFGIIRKVRRKSDGEILCRKEIQYIKMSQKEREQLHAEFSILASLRHPNIVAYYHRDHLKATQELHLYMEYCGGGDLGQVIKDLKSANQLADEGFVWSVVAQLTSALYRCHYGESPPAVGDNVMAAPKRRTGLRAKNQVMILHRDLKPENGQNSFGIESVLTVPVFLGADGSVKLGDFGLSKLMQSHDFASTYVGTPFYMSPEICAAERYTMHSDIWSLGCILYELCTKSPPFNAKTHFHLVQKIKEGRFDPLPSCYSPELASLVRSCLSVNPLKRPDTWDLLQLPVVRLMRKEREVVELGATLKLREERALARAKEAEALLASLDQDRQTARAEIDDVVRREWEVKARLEIDRQVALEKERLEKIFESELVIRVEQEVERRLRTSDGAQAATTNSDTIPSLSSISTAPSTEGITTDESSLFTNGSDLMESPFCAGGLPAPSFHQPARRAHRTPFSRARTQVDSPMDVAMASPSPMSIASLSLSPRRAAAMAQGIATSGGNLFIAAADARARWEPQNLSTVDSDSETDSPSREGAHSAPPIEEENDSDAEAFASPTRCRVTRAGGPSAIPDPFKVAGGSRPGLARQRTLPSRRPGTTGPQPPLFAGKIPPSTQTSQRRDRSPTSPQRRAIPRPLSKAATAVAMAAAGSNENHNEDLVRGITHKSTGQVSSHISGVGGRTLVELQQARAGMDAPAMTAAISGTGLARKAGGFEEVARWDPEQDEEMPSPFLCRVKRDFGSR